MCLDFLIFQSKGCVCVCVCVCACSCICVCMWDGISLKGWWWVGNSTVNVPKWHRGSLHSPGRVPCTYQEVGGFTESLDNWLPLGIFHGCLVWALESSWPLSPFYRVSVFKIRELVQLSLFWVAGFVKMWCSGVTGDSSERKEWSHAADRSRDRGHADERLILWLRFSCFLGPGGFLAFILWESDDDSSHVHHAPSTRSNLFEPYKNPMRKMMLPSPFYRWRN